MLDFAMKMNDGGIHFPVWGICSGHQTIIMAIANDPNLISNFNNLNNVS